MREWSAEVTVDAALARRLIREQFPEFELHSLRLLGEGWDNTVWLVGEEWVFRFPRRSVVVQGIENEMRLLPRLAPLLPLPIPVPTFLGRPPLPGPSTAVPSCRVVSSPTSSWMTRIASHSPGLWASS